MSPVESQLSGESRRLRLPPLAHQITDNYELTAIDAELAQHAEAVVTEAVSNVLRHSGATRLTIEVTAADELCVDVRDDGHGIPADNRRQSGLANMRRRAEQVGGTCRITSPPEGGTIVHWTAPLIGF